MFISANPGSTNSVLVPNLSPLSTYTFRIRAENDVGKSDYSKEIAVTTTIEGMCGDVLPIQHLPLRVHAGCQTRLKFPCRVTIMPFYLLPCHDW